MIYRTTFAAALIGLGAAAQAQEAPADPRCEVKGENGMVTLLLCPAGLSQTALAGEGRAACDERMPCGAWMWVNEADVPDAAPDSHDKLPQAAVQSAVAIWVNEDQQLIALEEVQK